MRTAVSLESFSAWVYVYLKKSLCHLHSPLLHSFLFFLCLFFPFSYFKQQINWLTGGIQALYVTLDFSSIKDMFQICNLLPYICLHFCCQLHLTEHHMAYLLAIIAIRRPHVLISTSWYIYYHNALDASYSPLICKSLIWGLMLYCLSRMRP